MVGIPGQTHESVADDIELFRDMDMDMIGIGPYLPHPATPLGREFEERRARGDWAADQVPNSELATCKVVALTRLVRPDANLPATTALSLINRDGGRAHGLQRGANVVMPNLTPPRVPRQVRDLPREGRRARDGRGHQRRHRRAARLTGQDRGHGAGRTTVSCLAAPPTHPTRRRRKGGGACPAPPAPSRFAVISRQQCLRLSASL